MYYVKEILISALLICYSTTTTKACPGGWIQGPIACYFLSKFGGTWADANSVCQGFLGKLAEPIEEESFQFLSGASKNETPHNGQFYLGGSDMFVEGIWEWSTTKTQIYKNHWYPGNPSDSNHNEDCLALNGGILNDVPCTSSYSFICQLERDEAVEQVIG
ncbi:perlucin-like protein [Mizuhopecten yessoensis]|uniref:perlucin-like protein n=1 Tax=Mizuhopecten yessoensis TaxID=6573 RepID=UPI000B45C755|nr:perlucin-like protein [Mizuhopecten yessoensis]